MSLQVWLPLNGDLRNNGLSNVTITNNGATVDNSGKLGKCYSFNGSSSYLLSTQNFLTNSTGDWTYCCWMKLNSTTAGQCLFSCRTGVNNTGITIFYYGSYWYIDDGARWYPTNTLSANTWYHIGIVHKQGTGIFIYINGVLDKSTTTTHNMSTIASNFTIGASQNTSSTASGNYLNGRLNDVRIYDHALSPKEIKLLSQGLVCHYQLNDKPCTNLYVGTRDFSGYWVGSGNWTTDTSQTYDGFTVKQRTGTWGGLAQNVTATKGDIFTISFYAKVTAGGTVASVHRSNLGNVTTGLSLLDGNFVSSNYWITTDGSITSWKYCWATLEIVSEDITYLQWRIENSQSNKTMWITRFKLEKGNKATAWSPNPADAEYARLGYDENVIYDSSGNGYNGEKVGNVTSGNESPRNTTSMSFVNGSYLRLQNMIVSGYTNSYTFAWWGKFGNCNGHMMWGFANGNRLNLFSYSTNCYWNTGDSLNNPFNVALSPYLDDNFHHFAITGDGTTTKLYIDGEYKANAKTYKGITGTTLIFNGWDTGNNYNFNGSLSDFRLYATSLSADDIQTLYNAPVSITNKGAMMTQGEFVEVTK